uniref:5MP1/2-like HEAT domain-containing protein n=1 Tax=Cyprinus carpio TaxID=7962 RepID=A0A8C2D075_CYPCA
MNTGKPQKPVLTGQRFKTRKRDEKEKFEPTVFRDTIVQGLNEAGGDLDAVAKFLDVTGSRLDYRRYADTLFDILMAGSMLETFYAPQSVNTNLHRIDRQICFIDMLSQAA